MNSTDVPDAWAKAAELIASGGLHRVFVIGSPDAGKSTFCRFLCRYLAAEGNSVALIDADIGQKDIGPPACITSGYASTESETIAARGFYFVGGVSPYGRFMGMIAGVCLLTGSVDAVFRIVNTTGLVHGPGRALKGSKIEVLKPDVIAAIQGSTELELLLAAHRNCRILRIPVSAKAEPRNRDVRRRARESAFFEYFQPAVEVELGVETLIFQRSRLFNGKQVRRPGFIYCEESAEGLLAVTGGVVPERPGMVVLKPGFEENLLCGVADANGMGLGLARIIGIDYKKKSIRLISPVQREKIRILQLGDIYIDADGGALGVRKPYRF